MLSFQRFPYDHHLLTQRYLNLISIQISLCKIMWITCLSRFSFYGNSWWHSLHRSSFVFKCTDPMCVSRCTFWENIFHKVHLNTHIRSVHLNIKDYWCNECQQGFSQKPNLDKNIKAIHLKVKDYLCSEYDQEFSYKQTLGNHLKAVHLKIKDYQCNECDKAFSQKSYLEHKKALHLKIFNGIKKIKFYFQLNNKQINFL